MNFVNDILSPFVNSGADDRSKATDSTNPQTFIVKTNEHRWVRVVLNSLLVVRAVAEFLARGAIKIRIGIETFYSDDHSQPAKDASCNTKVALPTGHAFLKPQCMV